MPENACRDFFEKHAHNKDKVKELQKVADPIAWEQESASQFSPGIVQNHETVARQVVHPTFFNDETQKIKPSWFDDITSRGFSTDRLHHTTIEDAAKRALDRVEEWNKKNPEKTPRSLHSFGSLPVERIRSVECEGQRAFGVYDTGEKDNPAHADVCQVIPYKQSIEARDIRFQLYDMTNSLPITASAAANQSTE
ncbi:hypothetical protein LDP08_06025 [Ralstonia pseudosolanacearum]|uniref:hypothetical protein n=1 Tax=Ralstonia pseudosolanacearum TaxID=1310165 RepID=UPI003CF3B04E